MPAAAYTVPPAIVQPAQPKAIESLDVERFLRALADVETGNRWDKVGMKGELGAYQIRRLTWHCYTDMPFRFAARPRYGNLVAGMHVLTIMGALRHAGQPVSAFNVAAVWKFGMKGFLEGRAKNSESAQDVANLYACFQSKS